MHPDGPFENRPKVLPHRIGAKTFKVITKTSIFFLRKSELIIFQKFATPDGSPLGRLRESTNPCFIVVFTRFEVLRDAFIAVFTRFEALRAAFIVVFTKFEALRAAFIVVFTMFEVLRATFIVVFTRFEALRAAFKYVFTRCEPPCCIYRCFHDGLRDRMHPDRPSKIIPKYSPTGSEPKLPK